MDSFVLRAPQRINSPGLTFTGAMVLGGATAALLAPLLLVLWVHDTNGTGRLVAALLTGSFVYLAFSKRPRQLAGGRDVPVAEQKRPARENESHFDPVTGLLQPRGFRAATETVLCSGQPGGLLIINIDRFSALRVAHGSAISDRLLLAVGRRLAALAPAGAAAARLDSDEFVLVIPGSCRTTASEEAGRLIALLSRPYVLDGRSLTLALSIGCADLPEHGDGYDRAMRAGLLALRQAKQAGGRCWRLFVPALGSASEMHVSLSRELPAAITSGAVVPYYQPVVDLRSGCVVGHEVLARWQHPRLGVLTPDKFIPIAEEQGLCGELSLCLLRHVIADSRAWPEQWTFAFNAAPSQLAELGDFVGDAARIPRGRLPPSRIEIEVTETTLIENLDTARDAVARLHGSGAKVVLDDFGTGYANLMHLREIPFDRIKIDRSFVTAMLSDPRSEACVRSVLMLGRSLGVSVIAEGVESDDVAARLRDMGCEYAQGFRYAAPLPAALVPGFARQLAAA